jgi:hypothetical protein
MLWPPEDTLFRLKRAYISLTLVNVWALRHIFYVDILLYRHLLHRLYTLSPRSPSPLPLPPLG